MSEPNSTAPVVEGDIIAGKFRVERVLGVGGMGVVVAATHVDLEQRVALKFLLPDAARNPDVAARFGREARAAAKIRSEHVAKVTDVGTLPDGSPYMVMEYLDGEDLEHVLRRGPMAVSVAVGYVLQASEAVAEAHALGIVHRDLKPANLFLASRPSGAPIVKVLDFGISKATTGTSEAQLTKTSALMGSPLYMSPEQLASAKFVDARSDIWAMGVVLYELLVGRTPFPADTMPELVAAILQRDFDPPSQFRPDVPPELEAAMGRCLEKDPRSRFANIAEMAQALLPFGPPNGGQSLERIRHVLGVHGVASAPLPAQPARYLPPTGAATAPGAAVAATSALWSDSLATTTSPPSRGARATLFACIAAGVALLLMAAALAIFLRAPHPTASTTTLASAAAPAQVEPPAPPASPSSEVAAAAPTPPPTASASPPVTEPAPTLTATAVPSPPSTARPHGRSTTQPAARAAAPTCSLVSYPDSEGNTHFKRECH